MQQGAGDARELGRVDLAIGLAGASLDSTEPARLGAQPGLEKQPLDPAGIALEQRADRCQPAHAQQGALVQPASAAVYRRDAAPCLGHCDGAPGAA